MYDLSPHLDSQVDPGTNLLISGPPLTGKRSLALDILADGVDDGESAVIVTTKDGAESVLQDFSNRTAYKGAPVAVVDCVTRQQRIEDVRSLSRIKYTSSPDDMTGIGINFSEFLEAFYETQEIENNRVVLNSLSTLLMYSDLETVFRFLHVFTGRIQSVDGLGLFCIEEPTHDNQTVNTLKQLFDGIVTTSENADPEIRLG